MSIGMNSFEGIHGQTPRKPLDFLPILLHVREPKLVGAFACHICTLHHAVNKQFQASHDHFKIQVNSHRELTVWDVMVSVRLKWFSPRNH